MPGGYSPRITPTPVEGKGPAEGGGGGLGDVSLPFALEPTSLGLTRITKPGSLGRLR